MTSIVKTESKQERKARVQAENEARRLANLAAKTSDPGALLGKKPVEAGAAPTEPAKAEEAKVEDKTEPAKAEEVKTEAKVEETVVSEEMKANAFYPMVAAMPETTPEEKASKQKMLGELAKLVATAKLSADKSKFAAFDKELRESFPAYIKALETKHSVLVEGRKLIISFPKGKPIDLTNVPIGAGKGKGGGGKDGGVGGKTFTNAQGAKEDYMSILYTAPDGRTETYDSLNKFAEFHKLKYHGYNNATVAIMEAREYRTDANGNELGMKESPKYPFQHSVVLDEKKVLQIKRIARPS